MSPFKASTGIITIDSEYLEHPRFAAAYLIVEGDRAAFVDNNTAHAVPKLLSALSRAGLRPEQVEYAIITHIHLDHAGGSSALLSACPNAKLLAHPRAARHAIDPSRLIASARKVYGDASFEKLYGRIDPIPAARVREMSDGEELAFGSRTLKFLHTRGHANHHFCVLDSGSSGIFTGDAFGLRYPDLQSGGLFVFPSTSPTDFDAEEARRSVRRIVDSGARTAFLTHFGELGELREAGDQLISHLDFCEQLLADAIRSPEQDAGLPAFCERRIGERMRAELSSRGIALEGREAKLLALDIELNAAGISHVAVKRRGGKLEAKP